MEFAGCFHCGDVLVGGRSRYYIDGLSGAASLNYRRLEEPPRREPSILEQQTQESNKSGQAETNNSDNNACPQQGGNRTCFDCSIGLRVWDGLGFSSGCRACLGLVLSV